ncbi:TPA: thiazole synthase [Campylobacter lari]|nr:thiazole synthase [Campylobacter lari]
MEKLKIGKYEFNSRFILGSGKFSFELIKSAIEEAKVEIITLALRRVNDKGIENILDFIPKHIKLLPNTSGARNANEALRIARLARELGCGDMIKVEVISDSKYLLPDNYESIKAVELLANEGFTPLVYMYPDLYAARTMANAGAAAIMPLGAPIGSNKGLKTKEFIQILLNEISLPIIVDAGIGNPAQACEAMQMGVSAVMANTAIAQAKDVAKMAKAFALAIEAGCNAYLAGIANESTPSASSPLSGFLRD